MGSVWTRPEDPLWKAGVETANKARLWPRFPRQHDWIPLSLQNIPGWSVSCSRWLALAWHTRSALSPIRTLAPFGMSQRNEVQALTFIIRHIPQRCVAGIAFVLAFIETSFNPALYRRKNKQWVREMLCAGDRSITNPLENTATNLLQVSLDQKWTVHVAPRTTLLLSLRAARRQHGRWKTHLKISWSKSTNSGTFEAQYCQLRIIFLYKWHTFPRSDL